MRQLKVALVSEHASPLATLGDIDAGGQNVHVAALAAELGRLGCRVRVYSRRDGPAAERCVGFAPNVEVEHLDAGPARPIPKDHLFRHMPAFASCLRRRWQAQPPDIVHAHFWMSGWAAVASGVQRPVVQTFHALGAVKQRHQRSEDTSPPQRQWVEAELVQCTDRVIATCSDEVRELVALGADPERVSVVPCGVSMSRFHPDGPALPRYGAPHRIVVVSRLAPRKGIDDVIAALVHLPETELVIAGGPSLDRLAADPEASRLRAVAEDCGVASRVLFLGGVPHDQVPEVIRSADVVVSVPWYEPFGIVPIEAMACGVPVVGSAVGGLLDTVLYGRTGYLVPPRHPRALADAVAQLLGNPSLRTHMGQEGVARVRQHFTWTQVAASTLDVYEHVLATAQPWAESA
jgi:glycosyltransferase involved in cell wall biosynthesis